MESKRVGKFPCFACQLRICRNLATGSLWQVAHKTNGWATTREANGWASSHWASKVPRTPCRQPAGSHQWVEEEEGKRTDGQLASGYLGKQGPTRTKQAGSYHHHPLDAKTLTVWYFSKHYQMQNILVTTTHAIQQAVYFANHLHKV